MNSIINPWIFYWIGVSDVLYRLMWAGVAAGLIVLVFHLVAMKMVSLPVANENTWYERSVFFSHLFV